MSMLPTTTVPAWLILSTWQPTCWNGYGRSETCHFHIMSAVAPGTVVRSARQNIGLSTGAIENIKDR